VQPWEHPLPPVLYKYMPPERVHVLSDCRVRFSQRIAFDDEHELQPEYATFGTLGEIWRFVIGKGIELDPRMPANILVQLIAQSPRSQALAIQTAQKNIKSIDELGVFCLTEAANCDRMWDEYADGGRGFVIGFNTAHAGFGQLKVPGHIGKVSYSDEPFGSFLGTIEAGDVGGLFRKRLRYMHESEWRSIRFLRRLEPHPGGIFLSPFDPASVCAIIIRPECSVQVELRRLVATDERYQHVQIPAETVT
jgi:DUF2971 family protein